MEEKIISIVCSYYKISLEDIISKKRDALTSRARKVLYYCLNQFANLSSGEIAKLVKRDIATISYGITYVVENAKEDGILQDEINDLEKDIVSEVVKFYLMDIEERENNKYNYTSCVMEGTKNMNKQTVKVVIKDDLFEQIGIKVEKCSAYIDDKFVNINGALVLEKKWDNFYYLIVKANLYDEDNDIRQIDYDHEKKTFAKIGYETFSINCFKDKLDKVKCIEVYPKLIKVTEQI